MPKKHLKQLVSSLPFEGRLVLFGSAIILISSFLPWYEDLDAFHMGDMFLGITGPLYLVGFVLLLLSGLSLTAIMSDSMDEKLKSIPLEKPHMNILIGVSCLFLLVLSSSVYFHTKFGVNITMKEMRFGMMAAFIGAGMVAIGGYLQTKSVNAPFESAEGKIEPLIDISEDRPTRGIHPGGHIHEPTHQSQPETPTYSGENKQTHL